MIDRLYDDHRDTVEHLEAFNDMQLDLLLKALGPVADTDAFGRVMDRWERIAFEQGVKVAVRFMAGWCMPPGSASGA